MTERGRWLTYRKLEQAEACMLGLERFSEYLGSKVLITEERAAELTSRLHLTSTEIEWLAAAILSEKGYAKFRRKRRKFRRRNFDRGLGYLFSLEYRQACVRELAKEYINEGK